MESKYKERANELLLIHTNKYLITSIMDSKIINAMCQLAEEVNKENFINFIRTVDLYSKEQVEELLERQRELSIANAKIDYNSFFFKDGEKCLFKTDTFVNKDSILNAKLKIEEYE
jgi:hypothetical protein